MANWDVVDGDNAAVGDVEDNDNVAGDGNVVVNFEAVSIDAAVFADYFDRRSWRFLSCHVVVVGVLQRNNV